MLNNVWPGKTCPRRGKEGAKNGELNIVKGKWGFTTDPLEAARLMIAHIDKKRKDLGIAKARDRVLFDMAKRREIDAA